MTITNEDIDSVAYQLGYDKYIPYNLIKRLSNLYYLMVIKSFDRNKLAQSYTDELVYDLVEKLPVVYDESPLRTVIRMLKKINGTINLRKLEARDNTLTFTDIPQMNYKFDLSLLGESSRDVLQIDGTKDLNTIELPDDVQQVVDFYEQLCVREMGEYFSYTLQVHKLSNYSDGAKCRKYKLACPTYNYLLATKNLLVKTFIKDTEAPNQATIFIDVSMSTAKNKQYKALVRSVLLLYADKMSNSHKVNIVEYHEDILDKFELLDKTGLIDYIQSNRPSYISYNNITKVIEEINKTKGYLVLITDGTPFKFNNKLTKSDLSVISLTNESKFKTIVINNGAKYTQVISNI